jgi:twitching motility two-component system response regulator PilH
MGIGRRVVRRPEMSRSTHVSGSPTEERPRKKVYQTPTVIRYGQLSEVPTEGAARLNSLHESGGDGATRLKPGRSRILVVDDDTFMRQVLRDHLAESGFQVATAEDGGDAMRVIPEFHPDVVVMDVIMPGENGYRVSRAIKEVRSPRTDAPPRIVLLTSRRVDDDPEREAMLLRFARADAMLYKPCDPAQLRETIARLLEL